MPKFIPYDPSQSKMVVVNYADQLQPGTFEHAIHFLIEQKLDLSIFHPSFNNDETGRPAYDPAILLKIILFAYSKGLTSSREIQWSCETNIIFKALSCDTVPHFTTIANFVSGYSKEIEILFEQVLLVCDEQGLLGKELFALDGCKMSSNAAKEWSGTFKELAQKRDKIQRQIQHHITEHKALDKNESRDDERRVRREQAIETLTKAHDKIEQFLKTASPRMGKGRIKKEVKSNITDNESAKMTTSKGTIQEHHTLQPVINSVFERFNRLGIKLDDPIFTADTGYANEANMKYLHENGINGYIPDNKFRQRDPKFTEQKTNHTRRRPITGKTKSTLSVIPASEFNFDPVNKTRVCPAKEKMWLRSELVDRYGHEKIFFEGRLTKCRVCIR